MKTSRLASTASSCGLPLRRSSTSSLRLGYANVIPVGRYLRNIALGFGLASLSLPAWAANVTLAWNANPESNISGYRLSYGTSPGSRLNSLSTSGATQATVSGLAEGTRYYFAVQAVDQNGLQSAASAEISHLVPGTPGEPPTTLISQTGWRLKSVSSQEIEDEDGRAINAFDGNPNTIWHSRFFTNSAPPPHDIQIDLGVSQPIAGFRYLPRQDEYNHGNIGQYEFYISADGSNWGSAVASGSFANTKAEKEVRFISKSGRYVWLRALTDLNGGTVCSMAELNLIQGTETVEPPPPEPVNQAPIAANQSAVTSEDQSLVISLTASDPDGDALSYQVLSPPKMGRLSGTAPNLSYTPNADVNGGDSFTFQANDGALGSNIATVTITITPVNDPPVAQNKALTTAADKPAAVLLAATDKEGDQLNYRIVSPPTQGALSGTAPNLTYTPKPDATGTDSFSFVANDGSVDSNTARVSITLTPVENTNRPPSFASSQIRLAAARVEEAYAGQSLAGTASDPDGQAVSYAKVSGPAWLAVATDGTLSGTPPEEAAGMNQFQVQASDSEGASVAATLLIDVRGSLPLPWSLARIGNVAAAASAAENGGAFELVSDGTLRGSNDSGLLVWQTLSGDGSLVARLGALGNADKATCVGLMIRESLAANSKHVFIGSDGAGKVYWIRRSRTGGYSGSYAASSGTLPNLWLRISRAGRYLYGHVSSDGSTWRMVARTQLPIGSSCYIGLMTGGGVPSLSQTVFENVALTP